MAGGQQAGFIYARQLGYYAEAGLEVRIDEGHGSRETAERVADGRSDFGYADPLAIIQTRAAGGALTVVSTLFQTSGYAILSLQSRAVRQPSDLRGAAIGATSGTTARILLDAVLAANHLDSGEVTVLDIGPLDLVGALRTGRVAAIVGTRDFHTLQLQSLGENVNELPFADSGAPLVGLSLAANDGLIQRDPQLVEGFIRASLRGWDAARRSPELAGRAVIDQFLADYEGQIVTQLRSELPLLCGPDNAGLGRPSAASWQTTADLYSRYQLLAAVPPIADFVTSRFIGPNDPTCPQ
jgi:NitT/TauT family transport system substrate-binding protein